MEDWREAVILTALVLGYKYGNYQLDLEDEYIYDNEVMDCRFKLYWVLLSNNEKEQEQHFKEFEEAYKKLSKEKQECIKKDLKKIFEEQDKNQKEEEKNYGKNNRYRFRNNK